MMKSNVSRHTHSRTPPCADGGVAHQLVRLGLPTALVRGALAVTALWLFQGPTLAFAQDVIGWGDIGFSNIRRISNNVAAVSAGGDFTAIVRNDGGVSAWGANGTSNTCILPSIGSAIKVACGANHVLVLDGQGTVRSFGAQTTVPTNLPLISAIAAGANHSLALGNDGSIRCWGQNNAGQCDVPVGLMATKVSAGDQHSLAIRTSGALAAWGSNSYGQSTVPAGLGSCLEVAGGGEHTVALRTNGTVVCWGRDDSSQCVTPDELSSVVRVTAGSQFSVALRSNGTVVAWGVQPYASVPANLVGVVEIDSGRSHTIARKGNGEIVCWGDNNRGQCRFPTNLGDVIDVGTAGYEPWYHGFTWTAALTDEGAVQVWGSTSGFEAPVTGVVALCTACSF
jgi:alpha-tubulin suppressor-like RCC1 family protein